MWVVAKNLAIPGKALLLRGVRHVLRLGLVVLALGGCLASRTLTDKLMDAAYDHNVAIRFGRMDIALEHVSASLRDDWVRRRVAWNGGVRVVDVELDAVQFDGKGGANVRVHVAWQRVDEVELRATDLSQQWSMDAGQWKLVKEDCASGDASLLALPKAGSEKNRGQRSAKNERQF